MFCSAWLFSERHAEVVGEAQHVGLVY